MSLPENGEALRSLLRRGQKSVVPGRHITKSKAFLSSDWLQHPGEIVTFSGPHDCIYLHSDSLPLSYDVHYEYDICVQLCPILVRWQLGASRRAFDFVQPSRSCALRNGSVWSGATFEPIPLPHCCNLVRYDRADAIPEHNRARRRLISVLWPADASRWLQGTLLAIVSHSPLRHLLWLCIFRCQLRLGFYSSLSGLLSLSKCLLVMSWGFAPLVSIQLRWLTSKRQGWSTGSCMGERC